MCAEHNPEYGSLQKPALSASAIERADELALHFVAADDETRDSIAALARTIAALAAGKIIAIKTHAGYRLMCDARNDIAVARLRVKISRPHQALAVMFPPAGMDGLDAVRTAVDLTAEHECLLQEPAGAIVLAAKKSCLSLSPRLAPHLREIGVCLPHSPLQKMLLKGFGKPLVSVAADLDAACLDKDELLARLAQMAEASLHHDRPFETSGEDNTYRVLAGQARPLHWGRGKAFLELRLPFTLSKPVLAVGASTQNNVALAWQDRVILSPYIGDMDTPNRLGLLEKTIADMQAHYGVRAQYIAGDAHLASISTRWARRTGLQFVSVFHHHAHAAALTGEHPDVERWLIFTWDGMGYGMDGTFWGGEALLGRAGDWERVASLRPFRLVGGEKSRYEPWRTASSLCWEAGIKWNGCLEDTTLAHHAWQRGLNSPATTSIGCLFGAAAALTGLNYRSSYSGQAAMLLEAACDGEADADAVDLPLTRNRLDVWETDWSPLLPFLMNERISIAERASGFHASLAQSLLLQARMIRDQHGAVVIGLNGSVFQNRILLEQVLLLLSKDGFNVRLPHQIPCNNTGISFGQIIETRTKLV
ncbi:MAG: carbamoyltransferase HypF [Gammaproteobacteria bacterium]|nr:carbamoyltransferase HypF [Gammaproteobacteria bacterium]